MLRAVSIVLVLSVLACSGSPTAPSVPVVSSPQALAVVVRDGITGEVVSASVQQSGGMVTVTAPGFLTRTQPVAPAVYLWQQPEEYVRALVYTSSATGSVLPLIRWKRTGVRVAFGAGRERHDGLLAESVAEMNRVTGHSFMALPAGSVADVRISVDPARVPTGFIAVALPAFAPADYGLINAEILFARESTISDPRDSVLLHELGHAIGLNHSVDRQDVMQNGSQMPRRSFSDSESRALTMMYSWRKAGNTFPDSEAQGLAMGRAQTFVIACR